MFIRNRNFAGVGYHDPVYDETGGQGSAVQTMAPPAPAPDPTVLYIVAGIIIFFMLQD